jgi:hypothetical protein
MDGYKCECVKIATNYTNSAYICNKFTKKFKKIELFGSILLRNFLLKSDFLGIFKNVLTGFYCISALKQPPFTVWYSADHCRHLILAPKVQPGRWPAAVDQ